MIRPLAFYYKISSSTGQIHRYPFRQFHVLAASTIAHCTNLSKHFAQVNRYRWKKKNTTNPTNNSVLYNLTWTTYWCGG